jgi:hypothetical protein
MKISKVCFEYRQDDGEMLTRTLTDADAEQWGDWLKQVCLQAHIRNRNPDWSSLGWQENTHRIVAVNAEQAVKK